MSWGIRITVLYLSFVALIVTLVVLCFGQKVDLVSKDYYNQELQYESRIEAINNANALTDGIDYSVEVNQIALKVNPTFIQNGYKGEIYFFRPSDPAQDVKMQLKFSESGEQIIPSKQLQHGVYNMQLSWQSGGKSYYKESVINIK